MLRIFRIGLALASAAALGMVAYRLVRGEAGDDAMDDDRRAFFPADRPPFSEAAESMED